MYMYFSWLYFKIQSNTIHYNTIQYNQERKVELLEGDYEQSQADLKLAFKRIADLQAVIEDDLQGDSDEDSVDGGR